MQAARRALRPVGSADLRHRRPARGDAHGLERRSRAGPGGERAAKRARRVRVEARRAAALPGRHLEGRRPRRDRRGRRPACSASPGATTTRASGSRTAAAASSSSARALSEAVEKVEEVEEKKAKPLQYVPNAGFRIISGEKGEIYVRLMSYARYLNQKGLDPTYEDSFGNTKTVPAARGLPAQQVLPALLGLVPDAEDALLPLRLVLEPVAGRPGAGGGRRQPELRVQPPRDLRGRDHQPSERAQHRGPVPLLAGRRRPPDRGRVLPRLLHDRDLAEGRDLHEVQVHGDARQQPEHARRERVADRQHDRHDGAHAAVAADDGRVRPLRDLRRLRPPREPGDAPRRPLHAQHGGQAEPAGHERHREQPDPAHRRQRHLHARPLRPGHHGREGRPTTW